MAWHCPLSPTLPGQTPQKCKSCVMCSAENCLLEILFVLQTHMQKVQTKLAVRMAWHCPLCRQRCPGKRRRTVSRVFVVVVVVCLFWPVCLQKIVYL